MQLKNISTIIWDLDGTLIDSFDISEEILLEITSETNRPMPSKEVRLLHYHGSLDDTLKKTLSLSDEELGPILKSFLQKQDKLYEGDVNSHFYKDALSLVKKAADCSITQIVLTNRSHKGRGLASPRSIIVNSVLAGHIKDVICGDEVEHRKPDPRSLDEWLKHNRINPKNILIIGDQFVDAQLAENIGARALLVKRNDEIPHLNDDEAMIVESLDEVFFSIP